MSTQLRQAGRGRATMPWLRRIRFNVARAIDQALGEDPASTIWMAGVAAEDVPDSESHG